MSTSKEMTMKELDKIENGHAECYECPPDDYWGDDKPRRLSGISVNSLGKPDPLAYEIKYVMSRAEISDMCAPLWRYDSEDVAIWSRKRYESQDKWLLNLALNKETVDLTFSDSANEWRGQFFDQKRFCFISISATTKSRNKLLSLGRDQKVITLKISEKRLSITELHDHLDDLSRR